MGKRDDRKLLEFREEMGGVGGGGKGKAVKREALGKGRASRKIGTRTEISQGERGDSRGANLRVEGGKTGLIKKWGKLPQTEGSVRADI